SESTMPGVRTTVSQVWEASTEPGGFQGGAVLAARLVSVATADAETAAGVPAPSAAASVGAARARAALDSAHAAPASAATSVSGPKDGMSRRLFYDCGAPSMGRLPPPGVAARVRPDRSACRALPWRPPPARA